MRRYQKLATLTRLLLLVVLVVNTFAPAISLRAQETTPDAPPTETTPETTPVVEAPTSTPTDQPPVVIPPQNPPTAGSLFLADFNTGDTSAFLITGDWAVVGDSATFTTSSPSATAIVNGMLWDNFITVTSVTIAQGGEALIGLRVGAESYAIRISDSGNATLWRGLAQIGGAVVPVTDSTPDPLALPAVYEVAISAIGGNIAVAVNNVTQITVSDPAPLVSGYIVFGTTAESNGAVGYDNILIQAQVPATEETPVTPVETPIIIPPLDPTPENTPVVEVTPEATLPVEATATPVVEVTAEITPEATLPVEATLEVTPEITPEITPELTPEITPEVTETALPLSLDEAEIAKLDGVIYSLLQAYYGGDEEGARTFATENYLNWREDGRLQVWVYPYAVENIPAIAATLLELGGEVLYLSDSSIDVVVTLDTLVEIARDGRIFAITLPVPAVPTSTGDVQNNAVGTPQLMATSGTGVVIPHTLDQLGITSWHEADVLGAGVNIAVIDTGFVTAGNAAERACLGSNTVTNGAGSGSHGMNVVEVLCDVAPLADVWMYTATDGNSLATTINAARAGGANGFPAATVILVTMNPNSNPTALQDAVRDAFNNNVPVIASAGNGGGGKNTVTFSVTAGGTTKVAISARDGDTITVTPGTAGNATAIAQIGGGYTNNNAGTVPHAYVIGSACGDVCQLELTITRTNATSYTISSSWANAVIVPDSSVTLNAGADQLVDFTESYNVLAVGSVCGTQSGRFPLTSTSPQGVIGQANTGRIKPDLVAPTNVNTSLVGGATVDTTFLCSGGFTGSSASAAHVAGMAALVISNPNMYGINNVTTGRPWQLFSYLKSRALDVNSNGFDRGYGAGVATLGAPTYNLFYERTLTNNVDAAGFNAGNTLYVSSDRLSNFNITTNVGVPVYPAVDPAIPTPNGSIGNPFTHITHALQYAVNNPAFVNIVVLPGEYPSSFTIPKDGLTLAAYDYADSGDHPASQIWVNDIGVILGGGINIIGRSNTTVSGFEFYGASPDYMSVEAQMDIQKVAPLAVTNSGGAGAVTIVGNTFINFDRPIMITGSENIAFRNNTFTGFDVASTESAAVLFLINSGLTTPLAIERNVFQSNTIGSQPTSYNNALIFVNASQMRFYGNRMTLNSAPSLVTIDMWTDYGVTFQAGRNVMFSNAIYDNTTTEPLIHIAQGREFQFINNTVANNILNTGNNNRVAIFGLGYNNESNTNFGNFVAGTHKFDVHNNIFFANRNNADSATSLKLFSEVAGVYVGMVCTSLIDNSGNYARYNWFISTGSAFYPGGECSVSPSGTQNNVATVLTTLTQADISTFYNATFFTVANDPDHPYRIRPDAVVNANPAFDPNPGLTMDGLIVTGVAGTTTLTSKNPSTDTRALDALGNPRFVDQTDLSFDVVDYGAYELSQPDDVEFFNNNGGAYSAFNAGDFTFTMNEGGVASINMIRMVRLGFKPYTVEIVPNVTIYDTNPLNSCNGQPYLYDPVSYILTYCPPADFHNQGITDPLANISFDYRVTGLFNTGTIGFATATVKINNVDDGNVLAGTQKHATDLVTSLAIPLRPRYDLDPFTLTDASGNDNKDYPFTFSGFAIDNSIVGHTPSLVTNINFATDVVNGVFNYTPPAGASQGVFEFTYTATDQDGDSALRRVRVRVVGKILQPGMNDNTALGLTYTGTWTPQFNAAAYSSSLHNTTDSNANVSFNFVGDSFAIGYTGNGTNAGAVTIRIDPLGGTAFTNIFSTPGLTCTTVTPAAGNPVQTAVNGRIVIRCSGVEALAGASGEVHAIEINNDSTNAFRLDFVQVDPAVLQLGFYNDTDLRPYLTSTSYLTDTKSSGGTWEFFNSASSRLNFTVDSSVKRIMVYRPMEISRDDLRVALSGPFCSSFTVDVVGVAADLMWNTPQTITLNGCTVISITRVFNPSRTGDTGVDGIRLLGAAQPLTLGSYHTADLVEYLNGRGGEVKNTSAQDGRATRLMDGSFTFDITPDVDRIVLYRHNYELRNNLRVRTLQCSNPDDIKTYEFSSPDPAGPWGQPITIGNIRSCTRIEFTRVVVPGSPWAPVMERMELLPVSSGNLGVGFYDNTALVDYMSNTSIQLQAKASLGTWSQFDSGASSLSFTVTPGVTRIMVYRPMDASRDDLRVSMAGTCTPFFVDLSGIAPDAMWNIPQAIQLNGCTQINITRRFVGGRTQSTGVDGIRLLGPATPLAIGSYHTADLVEHVYGRSGEVANTSAQNGRVLRLFDGVFTFDIAPGINTLLLYRHNFTGRDAIRIKTLNCTSTTPQNLSFTNTDTVGIYGFPIVVTGIGDCTKIEISRILGTAGVPLLERLELRATISQPLPIGFYDNLDLQNTFANSTILVNNAAGLGTWQRINTGGSMTFTIAASVKRIMVYRPMDINRDDLRVSFSGGGGCTPFFVDVVGVAPDPMWNIPRSMYTNNCTTVTITSLFNRGNSTGIDGIRLLGDPTPLAVGSYHTADLVEHIYGRSGEVKVTTAQDGRGVRLMDGKFAFTVAANVDTIVLYRHNFVSRDNIRIRTVNCVDAKFVDYTSPDTVGVWGQPIVFSDLGDCTEVEITREYATAGLFAAVMERMELLPDPQPTLTSGNLYQEFYTGLAYTGVWQQSLPTDVPSKRMLYTSALNGSVSFTVTGNGFIVYHRVGAGASNNVRVCVTTGVNPAVCTNYSIQGSTVVPSYPVGIYGLGSGTHTVTITNLHSGGNLLIDAIRVP